MVRPVKAAPHSLERATLPATVCPSSSYETGGGDVCPPEVRISCTTNLYPLLCPSQAIGAVWDNSTAIIPPYACPLNAWKPLSAYVKDGTYSTIAVPVMMKVWEG